MRLPLKLTPRWAVICNNRRLRRKHRRYSRPPIGSPFNRLVAVAPQVFSLLKNRDETITYINTILSKAGEGCFTRMDMSQIAYVDQVTVSLVISLMMDRRVASKARLRHIEVAIPSDNSEPADMFRLCDFHKTVTAKDVDRNYFLSRTSNQVNQRFTEEIINFAEQHGARDVKVLNPLLVEIFSNTNNHATPSDDSSKTPWFLSVVNRDDRICFSVIDLGIGIYESLRTHDALRCLPKKELALVEKMYSDKQSLYLAKSIPNGVYSSTKSRSRGKGLKTIYNIGRNWTNFSEFVIITNRALVDILGSSARRPRAFDSNASLGGTIYYWEMKK